MVELKSMKMTADERKEYAQPTVATGDAPEYPWGLRLDLDDDALDKLGLTGIPEVGKVLLLTARVEVVRRSEEERPDELHRSLGLQITDMALEAMPAEGKTTEQRLYGMEKA